MGIYDLEIEFCLITILSRELAEQHHAVPFFSRVSPPYLFVAPQIRGEQQGISNRAPIGYVADFMILPQISNDDDFVDTTYCHNELYEPRQPDGCKLKTASEVDKRCNNHLSTGLYRALHG